jgi:hypothetical protein
MRASHAFVGCRSHECNPAGPENAVHFPRRAFTGDRVRQLHESIETRYEIECRVTKRERRNGCLCYRGLTPAPAKPERIASEVNSHHRTSGCVSLEPAEVCTSPAASVKDFTRLDWTTVGIEQRRSNLSHAGKPPEALFESMKSLELFSVHSGIGLCDRMSCDDTGSAGAAR